MSHFYPSLDCPVYGCFIFIFSWVRLFFFYALIYILSRLLLLTHPTCEPEPGMRPNGTRNNSIQVTILPTKTHSSSKKLGSGSTSAATREVAKELLVPSNKKPVKVKKIQPNNNNPEEASRSLSLFAQYPANLVHFTPGGLCFSILTIKAFGFGLLIIFKYIIITLS